MQWSTRGFVALIGVALFAVSLSYSQGMMRRMSAEERVDTLAKQLTLTDAQKVKVLDVFKEADTVRQKAFQEHQGDREAMRAAMESSRNETNAKLKTILTEDQYAKYQKILQDMPMRRRGMNR
jgi:protein CpxP